MNNYTSLDAAARLDFIKASLGKRHAAEKRLKFYGIGAITFALGFLGVLLTVVVSNGYTALKQTEIRVELSIPVSELTDASGAIDFEKSADFAWDTLVKDKFLRHFPEIETPEQQRLLSDLISNNAGYEMRQAFEKNDPINHSQSVFWVKSSDDVDMLMKGRLSRDAPESQRRLNDAQIGWVDGLVADDAIRFVFNTGFFTNADSREPETAGILGAVVGSALALVVTAVLALPLAVMAAVYLEYFAPPGKLTDFIEVNINNLAAVPSIVFGLLGLAVFIGFFGMPRSAPLVGGMVLALMTLPTIIIATRTAIRAVPQSIRDAALGVGASPMQAATDHVLPLAAPGIMTGAIIGLAQALGETAPLIMIGMVAFIVEVPNALTSPATALPVQIFIWSDSAERAFYERSSLAIICLMLFLIVMNLTAVILRRKLEKKW